MPADSRPSGGGSLPSPVPQGETIFRLLVESVTEYAIFVLDTAGYVTSWNAGAERLKGYTAQEIIGEHLSRFYPPEKPRTEVDAELATAVREGVFREEGWRVRKDGTRFWADVTLTPMRDAQGTLVGFAKVTRDLSARRAAEEQRVQLAAERAARAEAERSRERLREAHEQLRAVFEGIAEGILVQDQQGAIVMANDAAARLCGFAHAQELLSAPVAELVAQFEMFDEQGQPFPRERLPARRALAGEAHAEAVMRYRRRGAHADRWTLSRATPLRAEDGTIRYAISIFEDISARRRVLERLRFLSEAGEILASSLAHEQTLGAVARLAVPRIADWCTVDVFDERGEVRRLAVAHADPARVAWAAEIGARYPVELDEPAGVGAVLRTGRSEIVSDISDEMLQAGARDPEHLRLTREAGLRSYICVPMLARDRIIGALTLLTTQESGRRYDEEDLTMAELLGRRAGLAVENARLYTQTQAALSQVTEISRLKDEFLATLSHELRTPLNAIAGWAQLLRSGSLDAEQTRKAIETIDRNAAVQSRLIADILDVSRIITGKVRLDVQPMDPHVAIEEALDTIRPAAEAKGIRLEAVLDRAAGPISGDRERLQQVLWNLLSNAVKFTPRGGRVHVRLESVGSHVEITVEDNGPGIAPNFLPHVFQRFRQADSSSTRTHGGLGLGLAIVRHLVEQHGGRVRAANRVDGSGAVFTVELPRRSVLASEGALPTTVALPPAPGAPAVANISLSGLRVMVVDDDEDARDLLALPLTQSGADVVKLTSADAVLHALPRQRPHVLLADVEMPGKDGYSLVQTIRRMPPDMGGLTPAIAVTAYAGMEARIRALAAGFDLHLPKPVAIDELRTAVARLAGRRR